ncbi:hypothetical protein KIN20_005746 [Parelaphostrongylus tenuis]|uniref:Uncharacterized protein n=1 Tax=Parelaphostrongylus tenuis TaxID=148309 RepID=A0AAD5M0U0_PARTN|nr:hypothetical protein KIN20_005746 [Parelaphostrongylus tenuis]
MPAGQGDHFFCGVSEDGEYRVIEQGVVRSASLETDWLKAKGFARLDEDSQGRNEYRAVGEPLAGHMTETNGASRLRPLPWYTLKTAAVCTRVSGIAN